MKGNLHTPWSDTVTLLTEIETRDAQGYETAQKTPHVVFCNYEDGVSQSEYYLSSKNGMRATAQVEIHKADMLEVWPRGTPGERFVEFEGQRYRVLRDFPQSFDTQTLILSEVIR